MSVSTALITRLTAIYNKAEEVYKQEEIGPRINKLARFYHYGYSGSTEASDHEASDTDSPDQIHVNKVYPRVSAAMAQLYAKRPVVHALANRATDTNAAEVSEVLLNYCLRVQKQAKEFREALFWSRLTMYGCVKLGMEKWRGVSLPSVRAHDPRSVRVDVTMDRWRPEEGRWQAFKYKKSVSALRASGLYEERDVDRLCDQIIKDKKDHFHEETTDVWIWENYVYDGNKILIATVAHGFDEKGFSQDDRVWIREGQFTNVIGLPGRFLTFVPSPKTWYPVSPVELWLDQLKEINVFRTQKVLAAEASNPKTLVDSGAFTEAELDKLEIPGRGYIQVNSGKLKDAMAVEPSASVNPDIYAGEREADDTITEIDGIGTAQLGVEAPNRGSVSATRDAIAQQNLSMRSGQNQEVWEEFVEDCLQGELALAQEHMKGDLFLRIVGQREMKMSREDIQGDIAVTIGIGSMGPQDDKEKKENANEFYAIASQNPLLNQNKVTKYWLMKQGDIKDFETWMAQPTLTPPGGVPGMTPPGAGLPGDPGQALQQVGVTAQQTGAAPLSVASMLRDSAGGQA